MAQANTFLFLLPMAQKFFYLFQHRIKGIYCCFHCTCIAFHRRQEKNQDPNHQWQTNQLPLSIGWILDSCSSIWENWRCRLIQTQALCLPSPKQQEHKVHHTPYDKALKNIAE